jgi:SAM-dependent methyltransferase
VKTAYDRIGTGYSTTRRPDPRIALRILDALGDAGSVVNVGAGTGSYEPRDRMVVAVEPSAVMIRQRPGNGPHVIQASAEALPLRDRAVDAALAVLTVHHWTNREQGLAELRRVARRRVVVLTWDQHVWESFWLIREYLPSIRQLESSRAVDIPWLISRLGGGAVVRVPIPHDCVDGFHGAFWRRPEAYLDPQVRSGISTYALISPDELGDGLRRLAADLESGVWAERHSDLLNLDEADLGYRLIVAGCNPGE